jgi:sulfur carrier protein
VTANVYLTCMRVRLNGESREFGDGTTVAELIGALGLAGRRVAVEVNRDVLPRAVFAQRRLRDGDEIEIVHFIGGG